MDSLFRSPTILAMVIPNKKDHFKVRNFKGTSSIGSNGCLDNTSNTLVRSYGGKLPLETGETLSLANRNQ